MTAQELLRYQAEVFLDEFICLLKTKEQKAFAEQWIKESYVPRRSAAQDMYVTLAEQLCPWFPVAFDE